MGRPRLEIGGQRFGQLLCLEPGPHSLSGALLWRCRCDCGQEHLASAADLTSGKVKSCGCRQGQRSHGLSRAQGHKTHLYRVWIAMKRRCDSPREKCYPSYGGRGIRICEEWAEYPAFHEWAISHGYQQGLTIDRINNDGNYEPENCRWVSMGEQVNNRRNNKFLTYQGETKTFGQWQAATGIDRRTIQSRIERGLTAAQALGRA